MTVGKSDRVFELFTDFVDYVVLQVSVDGREGHEAEHKDKPSDSDVQMARSEYVRQAVDGEAFAYFTCLLF